MTLNFSLIPGCTYNLQNFIYLEQCPLITEIFSVDFDPKVTIVSHTSYQYNHYKPLHFLKKVFFFNLFKQNLELFILYWDVVVVVVVVVTDSCDPMDCSPPDSSGRVILQA